MRGFPLQNLTGRIAAPFKARLLKGVSKNAGIAAGLETMTLDISWTG